MELVSSFSIYPNIKNSFDTNMQKQSSKIKIPTSPRKDFLNAPKIVVKERPKERYYSLLVGSEDHGNACTSVMRDMNKDVLRISLFNMAIYECYLFAFGLPYNFPKEQILTYKGIRSKYGPRKRCPEHLLGTKNSLYCYELTMPADTTQEKYRQQILNDLNMHFNLEAKVEKLVVLKSGHEDMTVGKDSLDLLWQDQLMMVLKIKSGLFLK